LVLLTKYIKKLSVFLYPLNIYYCMVAHGRAWSRMVAHGRAWSRMVAHGSTW